MRAVRIALLVLAGFAAPLAVYGFWAEHALDNSDAYADEMVQAWGDAAVREEVDAKVVQTTTQKVYDYFEVSGPGQNAAADLALSFATGTIDQTLSSGTFVAAWREWHLQLHQDLALIARGGTPEVTSVEGHTVTVDGQRLVESLFDSFFGRLALQAIDEDALVIQIEAQDDVEAQLHALGWLAAHRWWFAAAFAALVLGGAASRTGRASGAGAVLLAGAAGCLIAIPLRWTYSALTAGDETALGSAVAQAMSLGSVSWPLLAALALGSAGLLLRLPRRAAAPRSAVPADSA